jgi:hypothetical protein
MTPKRPRDPNQLAKLIVDLTTGTATEETPEHDDSGKDSAAISLAITRRFMWTPPTIND